MLVLYFSFSLAGAIQAATEGPTMPEFPSRIQHFKEEQWPAIEGKFRIVREYLKFRERLELRGGPSITTREIKGANQTEEHVQAPGFNTLFTMSILPAWEIGAASYVYFGKIKKLQFEIDQTTVLGNGKFRDTTFSPLIRYIHPKEFISHWLWFLIGGPAWSQQTLKLEDFVDRHGTFRQNHKLTYESEGGVLGFGLQENLPHRSMNPVYVEFIYSYMMARKVTLVDASNFSEVQTIQYEDVKKPINGSIFIFNLGMSIF